MAKLTILAALLVALLALTEASTYHTTIRTTTTEEENPRGSQSCQEQIQRRSQQLRHCAMYLQGSSYELSLRMVSNPQQQHLQQCCQQLENMDEQCRCEAVRQVVRQQQQQGRSRGEEMQEMAEKAMNLPSRCNLRPPQCQIRAVWF